MGRVHARRRSFPLMIVNWDFIDSVTFRLKLRQSPDRLLRVSKQTGYLQAAPGHLSQSAS